MSESNPRRLLSRKEAANLLGVSIGTLAVWKCTKRYPIPVVKLGRLVKYRAVDIDELIARCTIK